MASTSKRAWKLQEFVAHAGPVNCLALGHKSGRVMVTGGDDRKVNTWAVGKPNCIMSLSGHNSAVEAVRFGHAEEMVVAGSMSGALKIWDLEAAKIVRTLSGHKANIRCLDFHPYGDFVASGSMDTNIKIWDIRRKGCLFTYKGHTNAVNCLRFSPDGRWIVSGGEDGVIKLWDLTAGKQVTEFGEHRGPVTCIEFHPNEFLLASSSVDRTVKFWDLETYQMVSSTDEEASAIRTICFHPEGRCLYSGGHDSLRVHSWEPSRCLDALSVGWGKVASISVAESSKQSQLIGATFSQTNVSTFVVDLQRVGQFNEANVNAGTTPPTMSNRSDSMTPRKNFITERPHTGCSNKTSQPMNVPKSEPSEDQSPQEPEEDLDLNVAHIQNKDAYESVFQPKHTLSHSPPRKSEPFAEPPDEDSAIDLEKVNRVVHLGQASEQPKQWRPIQHAEPAPKPTAPVPAPIIPLAKAFDPVLQMRAPAAPPAASPRTAAANPSSSVSSNPSTSSSSVSSNPPSSGLNPEAFLPARVPPALTEEQTELNIIKSIQHGHNSMMTVLASRSRNLEIVRALWTSGSVRTALDVATGMNDDAVVVDLLNIMVQKPSCWNLDTCAAALAQATKLLNSKYENYVVCSCNCIRLVLRNFTAVIKANVTAPPGALGVDLSREERYDKCEKCYRQLMEIRRLLESKQNASGKLGTTYRELLLMLNLLE